jgi:amino acid permease
MGPRHSETVWLCLHPYAPLAVSALALALAISLLLSFPVAFRPCRDSLEGLLWGDAAGSTTVLLSLGSGSGSGSGSNNTSSASGHAEAGVPPVRESTRQLRQVAGALGLLALAYWVAVQVPSVETVIATTGAVAGFTLAFALPALFWLRTHPYHRASSAGTSVRSTRERGLVRSVAAGAIGLAVACTAALLLGSSDA